jgi:hypothetical protein
MRLALLAVSLYDDDEDDVNVCRGVDGPESVPAPVGAAAEVEAEADVVPYRSFSILTFRT